MSRWEANYKYDDHQKVKLTKTNQYIALYLNGYDYEDIVTITGNKKINITSLVIKNVITEDKERRYKKPRAYADLTNDEKILLKPFKRKIDEFNKHNKQPIIIGDTDIIDVPDTPKDPDTDNTVFILDVTDDTGNSVKVEQDVPVEVDSQTQIAENTPDDTNQALDTTEEQPSVLTETIDKRMSLFSEYLETEHTYYNAETGKCTLCQGKGWVTQPTPVGLSKVVCPACLGQSSKPVSQLTVVEQDDLLKKLVPNKLYRENDFDHEEFSEKVKLPLNERGITFDKYQDFMDKILVTLDRGDIPDKSYYVVAPDGYGKKWFAFEMIKVMVKRGIKTTGLINPLDLSRAIDTKNYERLEMLLDADVIMVNFTSLRQGYYAHIIQYLMEEADTRGVPVFVFSRVEASTFVAGDRSSAGLIYNKTTPYNYGQLEQVGLQGREFYAALKIIETESNRSIGYKPEEDSKQKRKSNK